MVDVKKNIEFPSLEELHESIRYCELRDEQKKAVQEMRWENTEGVLCDKYGTDLPGVYGDVANNKLDIVKKAVENGWSPATFNNLAFFLCVEYFDEPPLDHKEEMFDYLLSKLSEPLSQETWDVLMEYATGGVNIPMAKHLFIRNPNVNNIRHVFDNFIEIDAFKECLQRRNRDFDIRWLTLCAYHHKDYFNRFDTEDDRMKRRAYFDAVFDIGISRGLLHLSTPKSFEAGFCDVLSINGEDDEH